MAWNYATRAHGWSKTGLKTTKAVPRISLRPCGFPKLPDMSRNAFMQFLDLAWWPYLGFGMYGNARPAPPNATGSSNWSRLAKTTLESCHSRAPLLTRRVMSLYPVILPFHHRELWPTPRKNTYNQVRNIYNQVQLTYRWFLMHIFELRTLGIFVCSKWVFDANSVLLISNNLYEIALAQQILSQYCGCWWPGAFAPCHQQLQYWPKIDHATEFPVH